jgi:hypothetical protein
MKKILLLLLLPLTVIGQWNHTYSVGDDECVGNAIQTQDSGFAIIGNHWKFIEVVHQGGVDHWVYGGGFQIVKTNQTGQMEWNIYNLGYDEMGYFVQKIRNTLDNKIIILTSGDYYWGASLIVYNNIGIHDTSSLITSGNGTWSTTTLYKDFKTTVDSGYIVCGSKLVKFDNTLNKTWSKSTLQSNSVVETNDSGYILLGNLDSTFFLQKRNFNGDSLWTKYYSINTICKGYEVINTSDGGFAIVGRAKDNINRFDVLVVKLDSLANLEWHNYYGDIYNDVGYSIIENTNNEFVITGGIAYNINNEQQVFLKKLDANGNELSSAFYGTTDGLHSFGISVEQTFNGGYIIGASKTYYGMSSLMTFCQPGSKWLIKTDSNGATEINENNFKSINKKLIKITNILGQETTPKSNTPLFYLYDDGTVEKKIIIE